MSKTPKITRERTSELALAPHSSAGTLVKNHAKLQELWQETNCLLASCELRATAPSVLVCQHHRVLYPLGTAAHAIEQTMYTVVRSSTPT